MRRPAIAPRCQADGCGWVGLERSGDSSPDLLLAHRQADAHAKRGHQDANRPDWARHRAGGPLVLVPVLSVSPTVCEPCQARACERCLANRPDLCACLAAGHRWEVPRALAPH